MNKGRIIIGEIERAGQPLTAPVTNFATSHPREGEVRFRHVEDHFVLEQWYSTQGGWKEVFCFAKPE